MSMFSKSRDTTSRPTYHPKYLYYYYYFYYYYYHYYYYIELTHSKTILENTVKIEPEPLALDFKNLSQYSSCSK